MRIPAVLAFLAFATAGWCGTTNVAGGKEASGQVWFQRLTGSVIGSGGAAVVSPREQAAPGLAVTLKTIGPFALDFSYTPLEVKTTFDSATTFNFGGVSFSRSAGGTLDYNMPIFEGALRFIALDNKWFRVSTSAVLKVAHADVTLSTASETHHFNHTVPIPMAGVSGQVNITNGFKAYGSMKFLDIGIGSLSSSVHDWEAGLILDWNPGNWHTFRVASGYRKLSVELADDKGKSDESSIDVTHEGPFVEVATSF